MKIKFRIWDTDIKKFVQQNKDLCLDKDGVVMENIFWWDENPYDEAQWVDSKKNVVVQPFIGAVDAKGREIYEGDIVEDVYRDGRAIVSWDEEDCSFCLKNIDATWIDLFSDKRRWSNLEVIGNILENPELCKAES